MLGKFLRHFGVLNIIVIKDLPPQAINRQAGRKGYAVPTNRFQEMRQDLMSRSRSDELQHTTGSPPLIPRS